MWVWTNFDPLERVDFTQNIFQRSSTWQLSKIKLYSVWIPNVWTSRVFEQFYMPYVRGKILIAEMLIVQRWYHYEILMYKWKVMEYFWSEIHVYPISAETRLILANVPKRTWRDSNRPLTRFATRVRSFLLSRYARHIWNQPRTLHGLLESWPSTTPHCREILTPSKSIPINQSNLICFRLCC